MKLLRHPLFVVSLVLFILNQFMEHSGIFIPFIHSYLDDLLFMPIVLTVSLLLQRKIQGWNYRLSATHLLFTFTYVSIVMEGMLPSMYNRFTSDPFDVVAYGIGIVIFQMIINKPLRLSSKSENPTILQNAARAAKLR